MHDYHDTQRPPPASGNGSDCFSVATTATKQMSHARVTARESASRLVARAVSATGPGSVARAIEVSTPTVCKWADPTEPAAITLGDIIAAGRNGCRGFAMQLLETALSAIGESADGVEGDEAFLRRVLTALGGLAGAEMGEPGARARFEAWSSIAHSASRAASAERARMRKGVR